MNLYFMRHGIAADREDPATSTDAERPLTGKGAKRLRRAGRGLSRLDIPFDGVLTSPVLRARQSADIIAHALGIDRGLEQISGLAPESTVEQLLFGLTRYHERQHLLLIGHQPLLGATIAFLLTGQAGGELDLKLGKGALCRVEIDTLPPAEPAKLHWMLTPKQLRLLAPGKH
jgi:phosphohistidine phosphatase